MLPSHTEVLFIAGPFCSPTVLTHQKSLWYFLTWLLEAANSLGPAVWHISKHEQHKYKERMLLWDFGTQNIVEPWYKLKQSITSSWGSYIFCIITNYFHLAAHNPVNNHTLLKKYSNRHTFMFHPQLTSHFFWSDGLISRHCIQCPSYWGVFVSCVFSSSSIQTVITTTVMSRSRWINLVSPDYLLSVLSHRHPTNKPEKHQRHFSWVVW